MGNLQLGPTVRPTHIRSTQQVYKQEALDEGIQKNHTCAHRTRNPNELHEFKDRDLLFFPVLIILFQKFRKYLNRHVRNTSLQVQFNRSNGDNSKTLFFDLIPVIVDSCNISTRMLEYDDAGERMKTPRVSNSSCNISGEEMRFFPQRNLIVY